MDVHAEAGPLHVQAVDEPPGGATVTVTAAQFQPQTVPGSDGEDVLQEPGAGVQTPSPAAAEADPITEIESEDGACAGTDTLLEDSGGQSAVKTETVGSSCSNESCIPTPGCRICFQGAEQGELLSPCRCAGSVRHAHQQCLLKWISEKGSWSCELCNYRFNILPIHIKSPQQWQRVTMTLVEKVQVIAVFLGGLFLLASVSWLLWSALSPEALWQRSDILFQICYGMYAVMDLVCIGLIVHEGGAVYNVLLRWRAVNLLWDVQNYDKSRDLENTHSPHRNLWLPLTHTHRVSNTHTQTTRLESSPRCPLHLFSMCLNGTTNLSPQEQGSGELVVRVTSV
ncbi:E3 ubiquitin-protein ligase MARCHF11 [Danio rerio]|uniref:E3 ubiquitin-protein ligase MARCHF11 n=2 Tax=Danio rerio TaxID=7955 RepID=A0AC58HTG5_DANRE|nr:E3 ubiquitin-protein ligase MARCH11 [Danio rerio]|eukprot:XP_021326956.1 E3 ubiquitin-protein ligase MARCH11 [Danio rerio]